jgi:PAS domain S-box-containing protein
VVVVYAIAGTLWILLSDRIVEALVSDVAMLSRIQTYKGWFYILVTSLMLYGLLRVAVNQHLSNESAFRAAFDGTRDAIFIHDAQTGRVLDVNESMLEMYGLTREEAMDPSLGALSSGEEPYTQERAVAYVRAAAAGEDQQFLWHARRTDGTLFWVEVSLRRTSIGRSSIVLAVVRDVDQRVTAERDLREAQSLLHAAVEQSPAGIIIADAPDVRIRLCNSTALGIRGGEGDALKDIPVELHPRRWQTFHPNGKPFAPTELPLSRAVLYGATSKNVDVIIRRPDGQERWVLANAAPVRNDEGQITAGVVVFLDVTEMRAAQAEADERRRQLMHADRMVSLGTLVAGVAHEINNPNTVIMLSAPEVEMMIGAVMPALEEYCKLRDDSRLGETTLEDFRRQVPELLQNILGGSERISRIVGELKSFARDDPAELKRSVNVNDIVRAAVSLASNRIRLATSRFRCSLGEGLGPVLGNYQRLEQVVINLLVNAAESLTGQDQAVEITTASEPGGQQVSICVRDEGCGMDEDTLKRATDPFFTTKRESGGTGLGLAISMRVIEEHGGEIQIRSTKGSGTTATILLPVQHKMETAS